MLKRFIGWCLITFCVVYLLFPGSFSSKSDEVQYITLQNAEIELTHEGGYSGWWIIINDMYYYPIDKYPDEYENICDMVEAGEICIGVVRWFWVHFVAFNNYDYLVVSVSSPTVESVITEEMQERNAKISKIFKIVVLSIYSILSLAYFVLSFSISDGKQINKLRKYLRKRKKLKRKKKYKQKQSEAGGK